MSEKFGKGKILREMEKKIESEIEKMEGTKISDVIHEYYQKRKNLHKMKILKELYLESS
jgi:glycerol-3-phosphate dehydrogenase